MCMLDDNCAKTRAHKAVGSADQITSTVAGLLSEYFKPPTRSIFWREDLKMNVDPFEGIQGSIFEQDWDFKVRSFNIS